MDLSFRQLFFFEIDILLGFLVITFFFFLFFFGNSTLST